ncbi:MAG: nitroreductase family protein [Clostridia bacterium]|nr:nitroreductase family protein [Clostridia bacterium]
MALKTGRFYQCADVKVDDAKCTKCGLCVKVCKGAPLYMEDDQIKIDQSRIFGCIACGQCMAVCPNQAIAITGRDMTPSDVLEMPPKEDRASFGSLKSLMFSRRSIRNFKDQRIGREIIDQILEAAASAPNGLGATDVEVLVLDGKEKVRELVDDLVKFVKIAKKIFSPIVLKFARPFIGKAQYDSFSTFFAGALDIFLKKYEQGEDWMLYSAPLAMYFHGSPLGDPADPYIAATYAMLAAESLGLGSCMIGTTAYFLNYNDKKIKKKYGIPVQNKNGLMVLFGYPEIKFSYALKRRFAKVNFY